MLRFSQASAGGESIVIGPAQIILGKRLEYRAEKRKHKGQSRDDLQHCRTHLFSG
jgi:hypothetical protein